MKNLAIISCLVLLLSSCSAITLEKSEVMNNANLSSYKTFMLEPIEESDLPVKFLKEDLQNISNAVASQLEMRGYKEVKSNADLLVYLAISVQHSLESNVDPSYSTVVGGGYRYNYFGRGPRRYGVSTVYTGPTEVTTEVKKEGHLMMDLVDTKTNLHVYLSEISAEADGSKYRDISVLNEAVGVLFSKFPVPR